MRTYFIGIGLLLGCALPALAQRACFSTEYRSQQLQQFPALAADVAKAESFVQQQLKPSTVTTGVSRLDNNVIRIPVVVHILYHLPGENISDQQVYSQVAMLNQCFRRQNADSANTPSYFKAVAADCEIEFALATSDPSRRSTTGIIRKYTPVTRWTGDDQVKFSGQMGDDAWDSRYYLNIWVCNLSHLAGYSSLMGGPAAKDGVVIDYSMFGKNNVSGYELGRTAVHEIGHWLGLKHIWGDADCGDDGVADTPTQSFYSLGCPQGKHVSCGNGPNGDMYMNYMDYTNDACINLFTEGQKARMRAYFAPGGPRNLILTSYGLDEPVYTEAPLPEESPRWLHPQLYPNPATNQLVLDIAYDTRWIGHWMSVYDVNGRLVMQQVIKSKVQVFDISQLIPGLYFISGKKDDGTVIKQKFVKM